MTLGMIKYNVCTALSEGTWRMARTELLWPCSFIAFASCVAMSHVYTYSRVSNSKIVERLGCACYGLLSFCISLALHRCLSLSRARLMKEFPKCEPAGYVFVRGGG